MKAWKYITVAVAALAILLVTGWILRNTLIERLSNPLLAEYGLRITDVSLDALATRDASISYLELSHANGAIIAIEDLVLPIRRSDSGSARFAAARVEISLAAGSDEELLDLAGVLSQLLELPLQLPQTQIDIGEVSVPPYPILRDLRWESSGAQQRLTAILDTISLAADVSQLSDTYYLVNLSFSGSITGSQEQSVAIDLHRIDSGISMDGSASLDFRPWSPILSLLGIDGIYVESGHGTLQFDGEIAYDANQIPFVNAGITPVPPVQLRFREPGNPLRSMTVTAASTTEFSFALTDFQWTLRQSQASISLIDSYGNNIGMSLGNVSCSSSLSCSGTVSMVANNIHVANTDVARFEFAGMQEITIGEDTLHARVRPDATIELKGVASADIALAVFRAQLSSEAEFEVGDSGWEFKSQSVDVGIEQYAVAEGLTVTANAFLDNVSARESNRRQILQAGFFASPGHANWNDKRMRLPGFRGNVSLHDTAFAAEFETDGLAAEADIEVDHDLAAGTGQLLLRHAGLSFGSQSLSSRISPRPRGWDIVAGTLDIGVTASWQKPAAGWNVSATASIQAADLAGNWQDTVIAGLGTTVEASYDSATGLSAQPSTLEVALLDIGIPLENISARYTLHPDELSVDVAELQMTAFGGVITADPFSFSTARGRNNMILRAASVDLAEVLSFKEFEAIEISGRIGAELPVTIEGESVTVNGGKLTGDQPGGIIRYRAGGAQGDASSLGFVTRALSNFQYDTLTSDVDYDANGDLKLQMRLTGRNPDLDSKRPVILNLGVEDNVRQMLRSLQAARAVEEVLERRLVK